MSEMVERVARALDPDLWRILDEGTHLPTSKRLSLEYARRSIAAMREPTEGMVSAAYAYDDSGAQLSEAYEVIYTVMIDAALTEQDPT